MSGNDIFKKVHARLHLKKGFYEEATKNRGMSLPRDGKSKASKSRRDRAIREAGMSSMINVQNPRLASSEKERLALKAFQGETKALANLFGT